MEQKTNCGPDVSYNRVHPTRSVLTREFYFFFLNFKLTNISTYYVLLNMINYNLQHLFTHPSDISFWHIKMFRFLRK